MLRRVVLVCVIAGSLCIGPVPAEGASGERPRVEIKHGSEAKQRGNRPTPVTIVETAEQKERAEQSERATAEHEAADLQAQRDAADGAQRAAASAERQEVPTFVLATIGTIVGAIALAFSIVTANRNDATTKAELRAYVMVHSTRVIQPKLKTDVMQFLFDVKNYGRTPAYKCAVRTAIATGPHPWPKAFPDLGKFEPSGDLGPDGSLSTTIFLKNSDQMSAATRDGIPKGTHAIYVFGEVQYRHAFLKDSEPPAHSRFVYCYRGPWEDNPTDLMEAYPDFFETT
jgi:hypothetical protein